MTVATFVVLQMALELAAETIATTKDQPWIDVPAIGRQYLNLLKAENAEDDSFDDEHDEDTAAQSLRLPPLTPRPAKEAAVVAIQRTAAHDQMRTTRSGSDLQWGKTVVEPPVSPRKRPAANHGPEEDGFGIMDVRHRADRGDLHIRRFRDRLTKVLAAAQALGRHEDLAIVEGGGSVAEDGGRFRYYLAVKGVQERRATLRHETRRVAEVSELEAAVEAVTPLKQRNEDIRDEQPAALNHAAEAVRNSKPITPEYWRKHIINELDVTGTERATRKGPVPLTRSWVLEGVEATLQSAKQDGLTFGDIVGKMEEGSIFAFAWAALDEQYSNTTKAMLPAKVGGKSLSPKDRPTTHLQPEDISIRSAYDQVGKERFDFFYRCKHPVTEELDKDGNLTGKSSIPSRGYICDPDNAGMPVHTRAIQALNAAAVSCTALSNLIPCCTDLSKEPGCARITMTTGAQCNHDAGVHLQTVFVAPSFFTHMSQARRYRSSWPLLRPCVRKSWMKRFRINCTGWGCQPQPSRFGKSAMQPQRKALRMLT